MGRFALVFLVGSGAAEPSARVELLFPQWQLECTGRLPAWLWGSLISVHHTTVVLGWKWDMETFQGHLGKGEILWL